MNRRLGQLREEMFTNPLAIKVDIKEANDIAQTGVKGTLHWFDGEFYDRHYFFEFSEDHERVLYRLAA